MPQDNPTELTSVKLDMSQIAHIGFLSAAPKMVTFENGSAVPRDRQRQAKNRDGVPQWRVTLSLVMAPDGDYSGGDVKIVTPTVTQHDNPADLFSTGDEITISGGLRFGVSFKRNGGATLWTSAIGELARAGAPAVAKA